MSGRRIHRHLLLLVVFSQFTRKCVSTVPSTILLEYRIQVALSLVGGIQLTHENCQPNLGNSLLSKFSGHVRVRT